MSGTALLPPVSVKGRMNAIISSFAESGGFVNFPQYDHHICLVSEQTLPNYLGAIVPGACPKNVHLVVTDRMKERADILEKSLRFRGYAVTQYSLASQEANAMIDVLDNIYEKTGSSVAINVTGGTKIMALNAVGWANIQDVPPFLFYVDTDNRKILQIDGHSSQYELTTKLKLKELLKAGAGADIIRQDNNPVRERDLLEKLVQVFLKNKTALELFNKCAAEAKGKLYTSMSYGDMPEFRQALDIAHEAKKVQVSADDIVYQSEDARFWCNGGWLEDFVKARLFKLQHEGILDDWASNIELSNEQGAAKTGKFSPDPVNELDAAFTAANRFFVIECKTANLAKRDGFSEASYKLDSLRKNLGGVLSRGMIVSVHHPRPEDIQRCKELRIELLYGKDVLRLEEKLKNWI